jgi:hydroxymethylpyrimidine/phosphomethylpyrimidine kinase
VRAVSAKEVLAQAAEVFRHQRVRAVKLGALGSRANVLAVARLLAKHAGTPSVVDTPMLPTRGTGRLLAKNALAAMKDALLPRATLVTVNADEVHALLGERVRTVADAHDAARALVALGPRAALVKGGHLEGPDAIDVLALEDEVIELHAKRLAGPPVHGTGCTLASLIAGRLAMREAERVDRDTLTGAIRWAKRVHHAALARAISVGTGQRVMTFEVM